MKRVSNRMVVLCMALLATSVEGALITASARESRAAAPSLIVSTREIDLGVWTRRACPGPVPDRQFRPGGDPVVHGGTCGLGAHGRQNPAGESSDVPSRVDVVLSSLRERTGQAITRWSSGSRREGARGSSDGRCRRVLSRGAADRVRTQGGGRCFSSSSSPTRSPVPRWGGAAGHRPGGHGSGKGGDTLDKDANGGSGVLKWQAPLPGPVRRESCGSRAGGRYVSLLNESLTTGGSYAAPSHFKDTLQMTGNWIAENGATRKGRGRLYPEVAVPWRRSNSLWEGTR